MEKKLLKILSLCLLLALLAGAALPALAAEKPEIQAETMWAGGIESAVILNNLPDGAKITSIASSQKSVLKVGKRKGAGPFDLWMQPLKAGKSRVTVKYKVKGKSHSVSADMTVKKYPNPFSWIKVNGKKVNLKKYRYTVSNAKYKKDGFTVSFKLKSGWKLEGCNGAYWIGDDWNPMPWENGEAVVLSEFDRACTAIDITNKKTGDFFNYEIWFLR